MNPHLEAALIALQAATRNRPDDAAEALFDGNPTEHQIGLRVGALLHLAAPMACGYAKELDVTADQLLLLTAQLIDNHMDGVE